MSALTATRLVYLAAGTGMAAWAPIVPFAKAHTGTNAAEFGLLLLCLGAGSILAMPITGLAATRFGCKNIILLAGASLCLVLPLLPLVGTPAGLGVLLFVFGASVGTVDVAMNIQGVMVEKAGDQPLMSGFNAMFSLGGIVGAGGVTLFIVAGLSVMAACGAISICLGMLFLVARGGLPGRTSGLGQVRSGFVWPRGKILVIGVFCFGLFFLADLIRRSRAFATSARSGPTSQSGYSRGTRRMA